MKYPNGIVFGIVAGHGGMINGEYQILKKGSKQHKFADGKTVYEGVENRIIKDTCLKVAEWYPELEFVDVIPGQKDVPLPTRVKIINKLFDEYKAKGKLLVIWEIHLNAYSEEKVEGKEVYTTRGENFSDVMALEWWNQAEKLIPEQKDRPDYSNPGPDKEVDFYVIKNIKTFGVLLEMLFFTNRGEVEKYLNPDGYAKLANTIVQASLNIVKKI